MADKQDRWLDRETAERLLRGESPGDAVGPEAREQAEQLARTLAALAALGDGPTLAGLHADEELPGESAALKAFSEARAERERRQSPAAFPGAGAHPTDEADAGLVRIGGPTREKRYGGRSRSVRFGLAAALAVGIVGGVAAGTGFLPRPFDGTGPEPGASVSAAVSPDRPPVSPSPGASDGGGTDAAAPDGGSGPPGSAATGGGKTAGGSSAAPGTPGTWPKGVTLSCRDIRAGRTLAPGRRTTLENLAGGRSRVPKYCADVLDGGQGGVAGTGSPGGDDDNTGADGGTGRDGRSGGGSGGSLGTGQDQDQDQDDKSGTGTTSGTDVGTGTGTGHGGGRASGGHGGGSHH
ncbi:hypothetical protein [Streptomyces sp. NPDC002588]|uniref:hypothetical protein n=1 Tax=Streptomyces sp. NPDC002588 TaxID=3154419 RepID=UPI00332F7ED4